MSELTLWHGDCLELMKNIPDKSVDMVLCDLPYGIKNSRWDNIIPFDLLWKQYKRIIKPKKSYCAIWERAVFKPFKNKQFGYV